MRLFQAASTACALVVATGASASTIPLKAGDYGAVGLACDKQPNATTMSFDGRSFSYAHASKCIETLKARAGQMLTISETCRANGDGSPAAPDTNRFKLRLKAVDRFDVIVPHQTSAFRRCGALGYFDTH